MRKTTVILRIAGAALLMLTFALPALGEPLLRVGPRPRICPESLLLQVHFLYFEWGEALYVDMPHRCEEGRTVAGGNRIVVIAPYPGKHPQQSTAPERLLAYILNRQERAVDRIVLLNDDGFVPQEVWRLLEEATRTDLPAPPFHVGEILAPFALPKAHKPLVERLAAQTNREIWHVGRPEPQPEWGRIMQVRYVHRGSVVTGMSFVNGSYAIEGYFDRGAKQPRLEPRGAAARAVHLPASKPWRKPLLEQSGPNLRLIDVSPGDALDARLSEEERTQIVAATGTKLIAGPRDRDCIKKSGTLACTSGSVVPGRMISTNGEHLWLDKTFVDQQTNKPQLQPRRKKAAP